MPRRTLIFRHCAGTATVSATAPAALRSDVQVPRSSVRTRPDPRLTQPRRASTSGGMLRRFEALLDPTAPAPDAPPVAGLLRFYWHFIGQARWLTAALFLGGGVIAVLDAAIPAFIGRVVSLVSTHAPGTLWRAAWPQFAAMAAVLLLARPAAMLWQNVMINQVVNPGLANLIRWQNHWHVVRQSWTFFQNDFAGRIANRVMQTGPALRESLVDDLRCRLVHRGLRQQRRRPARRHRLAAGGADRRSGSPATRPCCAVSCRACATVPAASRKCART